MSNKKANPNHPIHRVLTPSWFSSFIALVCASGLTVGVIAVFLSQLKPTNTPPSIEPSFSNSWPLVIIWGFIGLIVYGCATYIFHVTERTIHSPQTYHYLQSQPGHVIERLVEQMLLRILAFVCLGWLVYLFLAKVVPYSVTVADASATDIWSLSGLLYAFLATAIVAISLHVLAIFLRLSFGKVRIFS